MLKVSQFTGFNARQPSTSTATPPVAPLAWYDPTVGLFDATSGGSAVAIGGSIARWEDQSVNANHAIQGTSINRPVLASAILNGRNMVYFNSGHWVAPGTAFSGAGATLFAVMKNDADPSGAAGTAGFMRLGTDATASVVPWTDGVIYDGSFSSARKTTVNPTPSFTAGRIYEVTSAAGAWTNYMDGTQLFTTGTNTVAHHATPLIGHHGSTTGFKGHFGDLLFYGSALNSTDRSAVRAWLGARWGITVI